MHILPSYVTTTNDRKRKNKNNSQQLLKAKAEHDQWLRKRGIHPDQLSAKKSKSKVWADTETNQTKKTYQTSDTVGNGYAKEPNVYTGQNLLGIAVMHKSCLVPVFNKENAVEIASMRR